MNTSPILHNIAQIIDLDPREQASFTSLFRQKTVQRKEFLLRAGNVAGDTFFVNSGCLRVYRTDENGKIHVAHFAVEEHWVSDMYSFLTGMPAIYSIDALEETEILCISKPDMEKLYDTVPKFERFFRIRHQRAFVSLLQRTMYSISKPAEEKYLEFKERYPGLELRIPQKEVASYLGITPEFLSMLRRRLAGRTS
jgi:CRP-like cAMP-binding protein